MTLTSVKLRITLHFRVFLNRHVLNVKEIEQKRSLLLNMRRSRDLRLLQVLRCHLANKMTAHMPSFI